MYLFTKSGKHQVEKTSNLPHMKKIEMFNVLGREKVTIPFEDRVTILTGINGSGKSTVLNVIFDSLNLSPEKFKKPSTSKAKLWASTVTFDKGAQIDTHILPSLDETKKNQLQKVIDETFEKDRDAQQRLKKLIDFYERVDENVENQLFAYSEDNTGEFWTKSISNVFEEYDLHDEKATALAFLYQEDRECLHNIESSNIDFSSSYWAVYRSSIDERFIYCRDAIQVRKSHVDKELVRLVKGIESHEKFMEVIRSKEYQKLSAINDEIDSVINTLNEYFIESRKVVTLDEDNKITLGSLEHDLVEATAIPWQLLSRGEKTLIYLFLSVYFYKDRVSVFLLDEPEISFHVSWQHRLIKDLTEIAKDNQFIIATHSPSLVKEGWMGNCINLADFLS